MTTTPRHVRPTPRVHKTWGYRLMSTLINAVFAVVLLPVVAVISGPIWYGLGA